VGSVITNDAIFAVKLNPGLPCKSSIQQEENAFLQEIGLKFEEETNEVLHLERSVLWCWNLNSSESR
jgi:hypothetical protein